MKYKIEFNYRYGKDYVYCNEYREDHSSTLSIIQTVMTENQEGEES